MNCGEWFCIPSPRKREKEPIDQREVLTYLFGSNTKQSFRIPLDFDSLHSYTDFIATIPFHMVEPYIPALTASNSRQEFKKNDIVVWKSNNNGNVKERATFIERRSSKNNLEDQAKIRLDLRVEKSSKTLIVPISELIHYKDYLKQFLTRPQQPSRVTVVETYQERSVDVPKVNTGTHRKYLKEMENNHQYIKEGYKIGKLVYNPSTKKHARISGIRLIENNGSFDSIIVSYNTISVSNNEIKDTIHGGSAPLAEFMTEWEPFPQDYSAEQPTCSRMVRNREENMEMETEDIPSKEENIQSSSISKPHSNDERRKDVSKHHNIKESKHSRKVSGKSKLIRKTSKEKIDSIPHDKSHKYNLRRSSIDVLSNNQDEKVIRKKTRKSKYISLPHDSEVLPSTSSDDAKCKNIIESSSGYLQEVVTTNKRNSEDSVQNSTEILKIGERVRASTSRENSEQQVINDEDNSNTNSIQNQKTVAIPDDEQIKHSPSNDQRQNDAICDNSKISPKIKNPQGVPLDKYNQKLHMIQSNLGQQESIPAHRKFSTPPGLPTGSTKQRASFNNLNRVATEINSTRTARKTLYVEEIRPRSTIPRPHSPDEISSINKREKESSNSEKFQISHPEPSAMTDRKHTVTESIDPKNFIHKYEINRFCGTNKGIQGRNNSCYLDATIFSFYYCSNIFDKTTLEYEEKDDQIAKEIKRILRDRIVRPLRLNNFCNAENIMDLRHAMAPLNEKINGSFMDAEELMFLLFENALKLKEFIKYSCDTEDFMHQIVPNPADREKCQSVQVLLQNSLKYLGNMKFADIPNPALILEMPRSNGKLVQYEAIIPNLSLDLSTLMENGVHQAQDRRNCLCDNEARWECKTCEVINGKDSVVYCSLCKVNAESFHDEHSPELVEISHTSSTSMDLLAVICIRSHHYVTFVRSGVETNSPWLFFDSMAGAYPEVTEVPQMGVMLEALGNRPSICQKAMNSNHLVRRILTDSHICIYQSNTPSSN